VLAVAQVAGIMAAKQTPQLIPMCHPIAITGAQLGFELDESRSRLLITAIVRTVAKTGVEMEALTAVAVAGLTVYDMCKAVDKTMRLEHVRLVYKRGGRSGTYEADT
jgi:cyclic pyranopterin phosphate synthase